MIIKQYNTKFTFLQLSKNHLATSVKIYTMPVWLKQPVFFTDQVKRWLNVTTKVYCKETKVKLQEAKTPLSQSRETDDHISGFWGVSHWSVIILA